MKVCPGCGHENADDARFCSQCATPLATDAAPAREERKVVTCLFCDLVGFTARAETLDPEDVRRILQPYHQQVRAELERFGGTVEKFIGDAVMAVFGAPIAHEDDPERAVRAALAIREALAEEGELEVRIGITTGEALIALGARPDAGEGMASGDVVNTAARLQAAAPTNGILVDETTYRATGRSIDYGEPRSIDAKGKRDPVPAWGAQKARARVSVERSGGAPLVGREQELTLLRQTLARVIREREPQLVTLVGVPGIGKSRLVYELFQAIESGSYGIVFWRHGRSLPYGEGVTFWALGEMVKAQAGILESDAAEQATGKLHEAVGRFVEDPAEAAWVERQLRPLAGLEIDRAWSGDRRDESFAAWRRYLEAVADERPLVLVFEDLHWADDALLDFVDHLVDRATGVPLLVLCTARPELLARRAGWSGGKVNSSTLLLSPLSTDETAELVRSLLGRSAIEAELQARLLEHAGGNPLYAEEFTRMLSERPGDTVLPETVQGLIAARLDTLPREEKELLCDAAVIGRAFWLGALGRERWTLEERLHTLERAEFVRRERRSSVAGEVEYTFRHALVRDVAYEQIPRAERIEKHRRIADWLDTLGRPEDHAEMLAHHYGAALQFARATGRDDPALAEQGRLALRNAGDRAFALNAFERAASRYEEFLELSPNDDAARPQALFRRAHALHLTGDESQLEALGVARDALLEAGERDVAAEAEALLARAWWFRGTWGSARAAFDHSVELLGDGVATPSRARVLAAVSSFRSLSGDYADAIRVGEEALAAADSLGLDDVRATVLATIGGARVELGDRSGFDEYEESRRIAKGAGAVVEGARVCNNLAVTLYAEGELTGSFELLEEALELSERAGHVDLLRFARGMIMLPALDEGRWDDCVRLADAFIEECEGGAPHTLQASVHCYRGSIRLARGDMRGATADAERALELAREARQPDRIFQSLAYAVRAFSESGERERARELASEFDFLALEERRAVPPWSSIHFAWAAGEVGVTAELERLFTSGSRRTMWTEASQAVLAGDFIRAAELFTTMGTRPHEAVARLRAAGQLALAGRHEEAGKQVESASEFFRAVGATRYLTEAEGLHGAAASISRPRDAGRDAENG